MSLPLPQVEVPEGKSGPWTIRRFTVSESDAKLHNLRCMFQPGGASRFIKPGTYTQLCRGGETIMSDTPAEMWDHYEPVRKAKGTILINGLGIGMVLNAALLKEGVERAVVVELSPDVITLAGPHYQEKFGDRLTIIQADAFAYKPPKTRFGVVWHDIWDNICADNLPEMSKLHRKYGRLTDWQGSWCQDLCRRASR